MKRNNRKTKSISATDTAGGGQAVVLDENLEISEAGALREQLQPVLAKNNSVVIDGSQIKVIDTAILQLLVALFHQAQRQGIQISWQHPSDTLCKSAALLGLHTHLRLASTRT